MKVLVIGVVGFIGLVICKILLKNGYSVVGLDNFNLYYEVSLKEFCIKDIQLMEQVFVFIFVEVGIEE